MANLIIKSSADNLVLQGSDASPAITVGATGTTTFAENATLSGTANNLGTVTAGTLSSAVRFPTHHVIQVQTLVFTDQQTFTVSNTDEATGFSKAITPLYTGSKILVFGHLNSGVTSAYGGFGWILKRDDGGGADEIAQPLTGGSNAQSRYFVTYSNQQTMGDAGQMDAVPFSFLDSPTIPSTPVPITYTFWARGIAGVGALAINRCSNTNYVMTSVMMLMEIAG